MDSDAKGLSLLYNEFLCIYSRKIMFFILIGTLYTMKVKFAFAMLYERSSIQRARIFSKFEAGITNQFTIFNTNF